MLPNCVEVLETLVGVSAMGALFVPVNFRYRAHELRQVLADARPAVVVIDDDPETSPNRTELLESVIGAWSDDGTTAGGSTARQQFGIRRVVRVPRTSASDTGTMSSFVGPSHAWSRDAVTPPRGGALAMMYTSGTSAAPKGALVPEAAFTIRQRAIAETLGLVAGDRMYSPLPLFHVAGFITFLSCISVGATYVTNRYFDAAAACASIERHRCRVGWTGFDTILRSMVEAAETGAGSLSSLEVDALIGPPPSLQELEARLGDCRLLLIYGSTELGSAACLPSPSDPLPIRTETSGFELTGAMIEILADDGTVLGPGEQGEICGRGVAVSLGYHAASGAIDRTGFDSDGWFHSGDLGVRHDDGRIRYISRLKDLIKVGGENVAAAEIESFLITHPSVYEVQVVGVPDDAHGEVPVAFVQWAPGVQGDAHELKALCETELSSFRVPRAFVVVTEEEWPRSATKIRKGKLREMFTAQVDASGSPAAGVVPSSEQEQLT
jgi:fatty-acyl-CoA synthase